MSSLIAVLRGVLLALLSGLSGVLRAVARHASVTGRLTLEGARAVGAKIAPAVGVGVSRAGGRARAAVVSLPGKTLRFLRGKVVEVLIMLVLTAGVAYFLSDSQAIRGERLACWLSDYTSEIFGAQAPLADGASFRVLVAQLDGDEDGTFTRNVVESLSKLEGIEVRELCRSLGVAPGKAMAQGVREAEEKARGWLADWHAGVLLWGGAASDDYLRLRITTPEGSAAPQLYELSKQTGFLLPASFDADFVGQLQAWLLAGLAGDPGKKISLKYSAQLIERLPLLRGLATLKGLAPEARVSAVTIYVVAYQRVILEDMLRKGEFPAVNDLKTVTAGLSREIDPVAMHNAWSMAVALEAAALMMMGDPDDLRAASQMLLELANHPSADPATAASAAQVAAIAWSALAANTQSADDMYRARDLMLQARRGGAAEDATLGPTADAAFGKAVAWLGRNLGDYAHAEEAVQAAARAAGASPMDDETGSGITSRLDYADLLAGLAIYRRDRAMLQQAIGVFETVLTKETKERWRVFYVIGLDQSLSARRALAEATGRDEDFARAVAAVEEAQEIQPHADAGRHLGLAALKGEIAIARGIAASDPTPLNGAIAELKLALKKAGVPPDALAEWCRAKSALADLVLELARMEGRAEQSTEALSIQREVVARTAKEKDPALWAVASEKLSDMMLDLAIARRDMSFAREAAAIVRDVIARVTTRSAFPVLWATNQVRLGRLLAHMGEAARDAAMLGDAEQAFRAAMTERPRDRAPALWFEAAVNAGLAETRRGEFARDAAVLADAVARLEEAAAIDIPAEHPDAQLAVRALAQARIAFARVMNDAAPALQARDDTKALLAKIDRARDVVSWAWAALHHANALIAIGTITKDAAAIAEGRALLEEIREAPGTRLGPIIQGRVAESLSAVSADVDFR